MPTKRYHWTALLGLVSTMILAACSPSPVAYATGARDIVVRLTSPQGGMRPAGLYYREGSFPAFTLFGDGTLIYTSGGLYQAHLDAAAIQQLLQVAVNDAHFFDLGDFIGPTCCDMPGSGLTVHANGHEKTVTLSILGETTDRNSPEGRVRRVLTAINALRTGNDPGYTPTGVTLYAEVTPGQGTPAPAPWPLPRIALAAVPEGAGLHLTGADAQAALQTTPGVQSFSEQGVRYLVIAVPDAP